MKCVLNPSTDYIVVHVHSYVYLFIYLCFSAGRLEDAEIFFKYQGGGINNKINTQL